MSTTIGGVLLDNDPYWEEEALYQSTAGSSARTLSGELVVQSFLAVGGRPFTLGGDQNHAWQKKSTVDALYALLRSSVGAAPFTVNYRGTNYSCIFDYAQENPVEYSPVLALENPTSSTWYFGKIKLLIVTQP